ncbi:hypothetical protein LEP1GSC103_3625 [Leptospira borgpetersenii serovar Javanica str. UI 09931]|uniref:Uncharacterized protein n=5 Tax=Leptospira borgpetersenii TaxID=174 RepID=M3HMX3_LEPBO|nr:hypothetical protein LBBP_01028 [Leptospira borgpetersenii serovar Ballum]EKP13802.1 hypothetical protein LEP1GSC128_0699 [Leptospira borgpetersenii str. 200801926]EKQ93223.1 hypothetical protein LEP1GSC101_3763 [Leptospira borgpetersenii str. UI 09149]EKQ98611.1 hypothetical protein LEP1GSC121_3251 [Leptospira borgpetersenii serovar Castellonis str. 200801910]EMF98989.1 hypothetical protein LEP1GSC123_3481 [Leptospira borgpetersenii str. 200701203]EMK11951.1 hypothetical protein LEP1GSC066
MIDKRKQFIKIKLSTNPIKKEIDIPLLPDFVVFLSFFPIYSGNPNEPKFRI